jgi:hypothetical protein
MTGSDSTTHRELRSSGEIDRDHRDLLLTATPDSEASMSGKRKRERKRTGSGASGARDMDRDIDGGEIEGMEGMETEMVVPRKLSAGEEDQVVTPERLPAVARNGESSPTFGMSSDGGEEDSNVVEENNDNASPGRKVGKLGDLDSPKGQVGDLDTQTTVTPSGHTSVSPSGGRGGSTVSDNENGENGEKNNGHTNNARDSEGGVSEGATAAALLDTPTHDNTNIHGSPNRSSKPVASPPSVSVIRVHSPVYPTEDTPRADGGVIGFSDSDADLLSGNGNVVDRFDKSRNANKANLARGPPVDSDESSGYLDPGETTFRPSASGRVGGGPPTISRNTSHGSQGGDTTPLSLSGSQNRSLSFTLGETPEGQKSLYGKAKAAQSGPPNGAPVRGSVGPGGVPILGNAGPPPPGGGNPNSNPSGDRVVERVDNNDYDGSGVQPKKSPSYGSTISDENGMVERPFEAHKLAGAKARSGKSPGPKGDGSQQDGPVDEQAAYAEQFYAAQ